MHHTLRVFYTKERKGKTLQIITHKNTHTDHLKFKLVSLTKKKITFILKKNPYGNKQIFINMKKF